MIQITKSVAPVYFSIECVKDYYDVVVILFSTVIQSIKFIHKPIPRSTPTEYFDWDTVFVVYQPSNIPADLFAYVTTSIIYIFYEKSIVIH